MDDMKEASTAEEEWQRLTEDLESCLAALKEDEFLILVSKDAHYFVQFAAQGAFGMRIEAKSNAYIEQPTARLAPQAYLTMAELGWHLPNEELAQEAGGDADPDSSPNFFLDVANPVDFHSAAALAVQTLRGVYGIRHPGMLLYKAFVSSGAEIRFPSLRLKLVDT